MSKRERDLQEVKGGKGEVEEISVSRTFNLLLDISTAEMMVSSYPSFSFPPLPSSLLYGGSLWGCKLATFYTFRFVLQKLSTLDSKWETSKGRPVPLPPLISSAVPTRFRSTSHPTPATYDEP